MKKIIVSFSSLPTITQGTSPTHRPIFAYRKPFRIARLSGVARGATGAMPPPQTFGKCFFVALTKVVEADNIKNRSPKCNFAYICCTFSRCWSAHRSICAVNGTNSATTPPSTEPGDEFFFATTPPPG